MKENCIIRTKYNWEIKTFKLIVYLLTFLYLTCTKEWVPCVLRNSIFFLFSVFASERYWYEVTYEINYRQNKLTWNENNRLWKKNFTYLVGLCSNRSQVFCHWSMVCTDLGFCCLALAIPLIRTLFFVSYVQLVLPIAVDINGLSINPT